VSERVVTQVAEDVEKAQVRDCRVTLCSRHYVTSTTPTAGASLHRPWQKPVHCRSTDGQPVKTCIQVLIKQVLCQQRLRLSTITSNDLNAPVAITACPGRFTNYDI